MTAAPIILPDALVRTKRPATWRECLNEGWGDHENGQWCPWVSCVHHLAWARATTGKDGPREHSDVPGSPASLARLKELSPLELADTCALRVAMFGASTPDPEEPANDTDASTESEAEQDEEAPRLRGKQLNPESAATLLQIGDILGVSRERVRQMESRALQRVARFSAVARTARADLDREITRRIAPDTGPLASSEIDRAASRFLAQQVPGAAAAQVDGRIRGLRGNGKHDEADAEAARTAATPQHVPAGPPVRVLAGEQLAARIRELRAEGRSIALEPAPVRTETAPADPSAPRSGLQLRGKPCRTPGCTETVPPIAAGHGRRPSPENAPYCVRCRVRRAKSREREARQAVPSGPTPASLLLSAPMPARELPAEPAPVVTPEPVPSPIVPEAPAVEPVKETPVEKSVEARAETPREEEAARTKNVRWKQPASDGLRAQAREALAKLVAHHGNTGRVAKAIGGARSGLDRLADEDRGGPDLCTRVIAAAAKLPADAPSAPATKPARAQPSAKPKATKPTPVTEKSAAHKPLGLDPLIAEMVVEIAHDLGKRVSELVAKHPDVVKAREVLAVLRGAL